MSCSVPAKAQLIVPIIRVMYSTMHCLNFMVPLPGKCPAQITLVITQHMTMLFISGVERFQKTCKTHSDAAHACSTHWVSCDNGPSMAVCIGYCVPVTKAVVISTQQLTPRHWASCFSRMLWYTDIQRYIDIYHSATYFLNKWKMSVIHNI